MVVQCIYWGFPMQEIIAQAGKHNEQELKAMLAMERELQPPADYITTAGAIGPEHRHFLVSWMTMVDTLLAARFVHVGFLTRILHLSNIYQSKLLPPLANTLSRP